jgi:hypothetical protein
MHILIACDQKYYDKWGIELLKSTRYYNPSSWLAVHCHIVNPRLGFEQVKDVNYTTEKYDNPSIEYLQSVRFLVASDKFSTEQVMILDADTVCTREFSQQDFNFVTSNVTVLKHHKQAALHTWLCGLVTLGTGNFRHEFADKLSNSLVSSWKYGHDQDVLNSLSDKYSFNEATTDWMCMGKQNPKSVFLTLKGTHKLNPKYTNQFERYKF